MCGDIWRAPQQREKKLKEMVVELALRCKLTTSQQAAVTALLASFSASPKTDVAFTLFTEIAKAVGMSEADMAGLKKLFSSYDSDG